MAKKRAPGAREKARLSAAKQTRQIKAQIKVIQGQLDVLKASLSGLENDLSDMAYAEPEFGEASNVQERDV